MGSLPSKLSASRGSAVLGLNAYKTQVEVWIEIMEEVKPGFCKAHGLPLPEKAEGAPLRWGSYFEEAVIMLAEAVDDTEIIDREKLCTAPLGLDHVTCHIDGRYDNTRRTLHEGKTSNMRSFQATYGEPGTDRVPTYIQVQVQHQMLAAEADLNIVSVLVFPRSQQELDDAIDMKSVNPNYWAQALSEMGLFHQYPVERNPFAIIEMVSHYEKFWNECVIGEKEPNPSNYDDMRKLFPSPTGTVVATDRIERLSAEYKQINGELKAMEKRKDEIKKIIVKYARDTENAEGVNIDEDSTEKLVLRNQAGKKLHSFNGKTFR